MSRFKTELCNNLIELGSCKYGDRCHYAHGAHELRQVSKRHPKYRTEKCKNFELTGKCPFGPRCSYVHPKPDLDSMIDQLTKYMKHTKAPKPDLEDDENTPITHIAAVSQSSSSSIVKTPLGISNSSNTNILTTTATSSLTATTTTISSNNYQNNLLNHQNFIYVNSSTNNSSVAVTATTKTVPISGNLNDGTCSDNLSIFDPTSFESNKKLHLISQNSSNYNISTASNPFGIYSPLSDIISKTNVNTRSPLQPNKQFYTRF